MKLGWTFTSKYDLSNKNFADIYRFFVIETPVCNISVRGISFKERKVNMKSLPNRLKKECPFLKNQWFEEKVYNIEKCCMENGILENVREAKEIVIHTASKNTKTESLFYAIRCAFAHGAFSIHSIDGEKYFFLENRDRNKLKARLILKETTLLKWVNIIEDGRL